MKDIIFNYTFDELAELVSPRFRVKQIWHWLYIAYKDNFNEMNNIPKDLRQSLEDRFYTKSLHIKHIQESNDGTKKYLFSSLDNNSIESVLIRMKEQTYHENGAIKSTEKYTICVSSQIGCKIGCKFCRTGKDGLNRNLSTGEIVEQIVAIKRDNNIPPHKRVNIVYMGMGEPLDNFDNVIKAIGIISNKDGLSISTRRQTISTSGISPKIKMLGELKLGVQLAISLHAVNDKIRNKIMPINRAYNIESIIRSVKEFPIDSRKRVMFEYLMIKGVNDTLNDAKQLLSLLNGVKAKINVILFNPFEGVEFERPDIKDAIKFIDFLMQRGLLATIRESKGIDIDAACGQLRYKDKIKNVSRENKI